MTELNTAMGPGELLSFYSELNPIRQWPRWMYMDRRRMTQIMLSIATHPSANTTVSNRATKWISDYGDLTIDTE